MRRSKRPPFTKQTEKLGGVAYCTENNEKKMNNFFVLQKNQNSRPQTSNNEETSNRIIRTIVKKHHIIREIPHYSTEQPHATNFIRRAGNMRYRGQTVNLHQNCHSLRVV